tara:strand:+ start:518 stop:1087 length:570 start_codon:yes stop_codon:yes gene_type:complete
MLIGVTGRISAGKGEVAKYFKEKGFICTSLSFAVREEAKKENIDVSTEKGRKKLQDLGNLLRNREGAGVWAKRIKDTLQDSEDYIIEGIRNPAEIEELRKTEGFYLISVDAPQEERYKRFLKRAKPSDPKTWERFLEMDKRDFGEEDPLGQQVGKCMEIADFHLINDSSEEEMKTKVEEVYKEIKSKSN